VSSAAVPIDSGSTAAAGLGGGASVSGGGVPQLTSSALIPAAVASEPLTPGRMG
jgi:hypothetical protein